MKQRSPWAVLLLPFITFGIYYLVWQVKTKNELKSLGASIPTAWLLIIPFVSWWWMYKYCAGAEKVSGGKVNGVLGFLLLFFFGVIGAVYLQIQYNHLTVGAAPAPAAAEAGPGAPADMAPPVEATPAAAAPADSVTPAPAATATTPASDTTTTPPAAPPTQPLVQ